MTEGLRIFILVVVVDVIVLLLDGALLLSDIQTITATVVLHPWLGAPLVAWQLWGGFGLFSHLYLEQKK